MFFRSSISHIWDNRQDKFLKHSALGTQSSSHVYLNCSYLQGPQGMLIELGVHSA
jgi:hypothetical protein